MEEVDFNNIEQELQGFAQFIKENVDALMQGIDDIAAEIGVVDEALVSSESILGTISIELSEFEELIVESRAATIEIINNVDQELDEFTENHDLASEFVDESLEAIEESFDESAEKIDELRADLLEQIQALVTESIGKIEETVLEPVIEVREECLAKIKALLDEIVVDKIPSKIAEIQEEWLKSIEEQLSEMIALLTENLEEFRQSVIDGSGSSKSQREEANAMMDQLEQLLSPVLDSLGSVTSLADSVGISIG